MLHDTLGFLAEAVANEERIPPDLRASLALVLADYAEQARVLARCPVPRPSRVVPLPDGCVDLATARMMRAVRQHLQDQP